MDWSVMWLGLTNVSIDGVAKFCEDQEPPSISLEDDVDLGFATFTFSDKTELTEKRSCTTLPNTGCDDAGYALTVQGSGGFSYDTTTEISTGGNLLMWGNLKYIIMENTVDVTALALRAGSGLVSADQVIVFDQTGNTDRMPFADAVAEANSQNGCVCTLDDGYDAGGDGVGREITANDGAVKIAGEDGLLVTGTFGSGAATEISGAGTRMFFNPKKGAFRAGNVSGTEWDDANIGNGSVAFSSNSKASGISSIATGTGTTASGEVSTATGTGTTASATAATAMGTNSTASANTATAVGYEVNSKSFAETSIGTYNTDYTPTSTTVFSATDRIFGVGNGISGALSDALVILKNGKTTLPSTTGSFTPNVLTTTERNALTATAGMMIYNSTTNKHQGYDGSAWNDFY